MTELEDVIQVLEQKREEVQARMEKGWDMIQSSENGSDRKYRLVAKYELLEKAYNRLILAKAILELDDRTRPFGKEKED